MTVLFQCSHKLFSRAVCCNGFHPLKTLHGMPGEMSLAGFYSLWFACAVGIVQDRRCISSQGHLECAGECSTVLSLWVSCHLLCQSSLSRTTPQIGRNCWLHWGWGASGMLHESPGLLSSASITEFRDPQFLIQLEHLFVEQRSSCVLEAIGEGGFWWCGMATGDWDVLIIRCCLLSLTCNYHVAIPQKLKNERLANNEGLWQDSVACKDQSYLLLFTSRA